MLQLADRVTIADAVQNGPPIDLVCDRGLGFAEATNLLSHPDGLGASAESFSSSHRAQRQQFRDLYGVQSGSLQELVCRHEHRDRMAARIAQILADAADQDIILA